MPQGLNASIELGAGGMRAQPVKINEKALVFIDRATEIAKQVLVL